MVLSLMKTTAAGLIEVFVLGILATLVIAGRRPNPQYMAILSRLTIRLAIPALVFVNVASNFDPGTLPFWWIYPLIPIGLFVVSGSAAYGYTRLDSRIPHPRVFIAAATFHNTLSLPLAIAPVLFYGERLDTFLTLLFMYNLLAIPAFFSVGQWLLRSSVGKTVGIRRMISPPLVAAILGIVFAVTGWITVVPGWIMGPLEIFGALTHPASILIVGGLLVTSIPATRPDDWRAPIVLTLLKVFVVPIAAMGFVYMVRPSPFMALLCLMGSVMPMGSTVAVLCPQEESPQKLLAGGILLTSLGTIITLPLVMGFYSLLYGW